MKLKIGRLREFPAAGTPALKDLFSIVEKLRFYGRIVDDYFNFSKWVVLAIA